MKPGLLGALLGSACVATAAQVVQLDIENRRSQSHLARRASSSSVQETIQNKQHQGGYFVDIKVGEPSQNLALLVDTGSSDAWLPWRNCPECTSTDGGCPFGSFDPDASRSYKAVHTGDFEVMYTGRSYTKGDYFTDHFEMGGATLQNLTMGLGRETDIAHGLLGVGYASNVALEDSIGKSYPNLPVAMYKAGLINTVAFSIWLNDLGASTGSIIFGGVDTGKYTGPMTRVDILSDGGVYDSITIAMSSLLASSPSGNDTLTSIQYPFAVSLDTGSALTYLPHFLADQVWDEVGAQYDADMGLAVLPCSFANHSGYFSFGFSGPNGPQINVTLQELVVDLSDGQTPTFTSGPFKGQSMCEFGIQNTTYGNYVLGSTFLRSAYVVYDLVNNEIGLAATKFNSEETNILAFDGKGAVIPSAASIAHMPTQTAASTATQTSSAPEKTHDLTAASGFQKGSDSAASTTCSTSILFLSIIFTGLFLSH